MLKSVVNILHAVASLLAVMACVDSQEYNYNQQGVDWSTGTPPYATCVAGGDYNNQSPIDIRMQTGPSSYSLEFDYGDYRNYTVVQDGHDLVITPNNFLPSKAETHVKLLYDDTSLTFNLVNYVIKTKAEHTLNGVRNDMEIQVLLTDAIPVDRFEHVMLSFIYKSSIFAPPDSFPVLRALSEITPPIKGGVKTKHYLDGGLGDLLLSLLRHTEVVSAPALHYRGSFTRPNCEEGIPWFVFGTAQDMPKSIIDYMVTATKTADDLGNYREIIGAGGTPANNPAPIIISVPYSLYGSSHAATYSIVTVAALFVACFAL